MNRSNGECKIDGVAVGEATISTLEVANEIILSAKYALYNSGSGARYGQGHRNLWSPKTLALLRELVDSMENDILGDVFEGHSPIDGVDSDEVPLEVDVPSL